MCKAGMPTAILCDLDYLTECTRILDCERWIDESFPFDACAVVEIPARVASAVGGSSEQGDESVPPVDAATRFSSKGAHRKVDRLSSPCEQG
jgi:hypothetical protein